jgi:hypothetical protein
LFKPITLLGIDTHKQDETCCDDHVETTDDWKKPEFV